MSQNQPATPRLTAAQCAEYLIRTLREGREVDPSLGRPAHWSMAIEGLLQSGQHDAVRHASQPLARRFKHAYFANLDARVATAESKTSDAEGREEGARRLREAFAAQTPLDAVVLRPSAWALAIDDAFSRGRFTEIGHALPRLIEAYPHASYFQTVRSTLEAMPPPTDPAFKDRPDAGVQTLPHSGADTALLVFTGGVNRQFGLPISAIHRWLGRLGVHVIYLREPQQTLFMRGIPELGPDYETTRAALTAVVGDLGASRVVTMGSSGGGYPALRYGLEMGASAVLAFGAMTSLPETSRAAVFARVAERGLTTSVAELDSLDLRPRLAAASRAPRIHLVHGASAKRDQNHALHLAGLPTVTIEEVAGGHNAVLGSLFAGRLSGLLDELVGNHVGRRLE